MENPTTERYGIVIVDMQEVFLKRHHPGKKLQMIAAQRNLITAGLEVNAPILVAEYDGQGPTIREIRDLAQPGNMIRYIAREFAPALELTGQSPSDNAFSDPRAVSYLWDRGVNSILLSGINAEACISATGRGGVDIGFEVTTAEDLISSPLLDFISPLFVRRMRMDGLIVEDHHLKLIERLMISHGRGDYVDKLFAEALNH